MKAIKKYAILLLSVIFAFTLCACVNANANANPSDGTGEPKDEKDHEWHCYTLQQAYDNEWLTQDDLLSIVYYYDQSEIVHVSPKFNAELMGDEYEPKPKNPKELDFQTLDGMKQAFLDDFMHINEETAEIYNIENKYVYYFGEYNGCVAAVILTGGVQAEWMEVVGSVAFSYPHGGVQILIWRETV